MSDNLVILVPTYEDYGIQGPYLGEKIYEELKNLGRRDVELVRARVTRFRDSSQKIEIEESIRGKEVYIIHPLYMTAADHAMIAAELGQAAKMGDAVRVILFDLYNRYFRQDRRTGREPVTTRLIAELYEAAGIDHVFTLDAHTEQVQMAFSSHCPIETLPTTKMIGEYLKERYETEGAVICSPDTGAVKRARSLANFLGLSMAIIHKKRSGTDRSEVLDLIGDVDGKDVYIRDDVTTTFTTLINAKEALTKRGARNVYACVTHVDVDKESKRRVLKNGLHVIVTNTIPICLEKEEEASFDIIDIAPFLASIIDLKSRKESIESFFETGPPG